MSTMIERVARAMLYRQIKANGVLKTEAEINSYVDGCWQDCEEDARTAIEAMREPTDAMRNAVAANWGSRTWREYGEVIDAALNEDASA